jgi:hypothetical protein
LLQFVRAAQARRDRDLAGPLHSEERHDFKYPIVMTMTTTSTVSTIKTATELAD